MRPGLRWTVILLALAGCGSVTSAATGDAGNSADTAVIPDADNAGAGGATGAGGAATGGSSGATGAAGAAGGRAGSAGAAGASSGGVGGAVDGGPGTVSDLPCQGVATWTQCSPPKTVNGSPCVTCYRDNGTLAPAACRTSGGNYCVPDCAACVAP